MGQGLVIGDLRVQQIESERGRSFTIVWRGSSAAVCHRAARDRTAAARSRDPGI